MHHSHLALFVLIAACSAGPSLSPPPSEALRADWQRVQVRVVSPAAGCEVDGPPTTLLGQALVGARNGAGLGFIGGTVLGTPVLGVAGGVLGGVGGFFVGPLCGESAETVESGVARLHQALGEADPGAQLSTAVATALRARGVDVAEGAAVACELRLSQVGLLGWQDFDSALAPSLLGELVMLRVSDGAPLHRVPFACATSQLLFSVWSQRPGKVTPAFSDAARQLAEFLTDELVGNTDIQWERR